MHGKFLVAAVVGLAAAASLHDVWTDTAAGANDEWDRTAKTSLEALRIQFGIAPVSKGDYDPKAGLKVLQGGVTDAYTKSAYEDAFDEDINLFWEYVVEIPPEADAAKRQKQVADAQLACKDVADPIDTLRQKLPILRQVQGLYQTSPVAALYLLMSGISPDASNAKAIKDLRKCYSLEPLSKSDKPPGATLFSIVSGYFNNQRGKK